MAGIKFLYEFAVGDINMNNPGVNVLSVTSQANGDFDKKNLTTTPLREFWRSSDTTTQRIVIQANDPTTVVDTFAILNHNFSDLAVVTLEANTANSWAAPAVRINMTWNERHMVLLQDFGIAYQYWRITIVDPTNSCGYIQIGRIVAGRALTITAPDDITDDIDQSPDDLAYKMKTEGFFRAFNERVVVDALKLEFRRMKSQNNANYTNLLTMIDTVRTTFPFLVIVDPNDPYFILEWAVLDKMPEPRHSLNRFVDIQLRLQEVY